MANSVTDGLRLLLQDVLRIASEFLKELLHSLTLAVWTGLQLRVRTKKLFYYFSTKTYVVDTQKNRLNETVILSAQNICLNWWVRKF